MVFPTGSIFNQPMAQTTRAVLSAGDFVLWRSYADDRLDKRNSGELMKVRILVVDDNAVGRDGLSLLLQEHADWEVCGEAADGIEAIEKYWQLRPDLLVLDVSMPRMNGLDAAREILKLSPNTLILLYTSYITAQLIDVAHKAGICGTVSKNALHLVVKHCSAAKSSPVRQIDSVCHNC
jgi:chemotaxis response regulator CheB